MLRLRDIIAALAVIALTRLAYNDPSDSLSATVQLSYYVGREDTAGSKKLHRLALAPVVLDVDGDGTVEALASVLHDQASDSWKLEVLDLKPAASTDKTHMAPFRPKMLYQSEKISFQSGLKTTEETPLVPVSMITGHVPFRAKDAASKQGKSDAPLTKSHYKDTELNDRNRHYFCGNDWHQASQDCSMPCPKGTMTECPDGMQCYADTPCDIAHLHKHNSDQDDAPSFTVDGLLVTPAGGLPSIFTLWSNGVLAMHSLTGEFPSNSSQSFSKRKTKELLHIRPMWEFTLLNDSSIVPWEWTGVSVTYVDATDASDDSGMVVVQAQMSHYDKDEELLDEELMMALDAKTGKKLWDVSVKSDDEDDDEEEAPLLPLVDSVQARARRRSLKPLARKKNSQSMASNCLHAYRRSLLTSGVMPYLYWGEADAQVSALHFEQQQHNQHAIASKRNAKGRKGKAGLARPEKANEDKAAWKKALSPFHRKRHAGHPARSHPVRGKPNVVVRKSERGVQVRSLKNGRSVCHVSLWYDTLYTDLNHDGVLDGIFVVTGDHLVQDDDKYELSEDAKWISKLAGRLKESKILSGDGSGTDEDQHFEDKNQKLCHLMALSGIPTKEELFSVNLCSNNREYQDSLDPAPLLAVETTYGKGQDVVVALNDKSVQRFRGKSGRKMWHLHGKRTEDFPTWENGYVSLLDRIDAPNVVPAARPMVLVGDSSLALISPGHGGVLATATFPQPSIRRPILVDFNGDGTTDVVVLTQEAVWGYRVTVHTGSSIFFRITVGLVVLGMMLAILRNRFGPQPGKRSTDA